MNWQSKDEGLNHMDEALREQQIKSAANAIAEELNADVLFLNSGFNRGMDRYLISLTCKRKRRPNIVAIIISEGGDADVAYRIARLFQDKYTEFTAIISGYCKSAGTLCALGATELVFGPHGELGPLDVQYAKKDELAEFASGLVVREALSKIQDQAYKAFIEYMLRITMASEGQISFKLASDVASTLTVGLFKPLYKQIDPVLLGDLERGMTIAKAYGERLRVKSKNYSSEKLQVLAETYPSHGFVIDQREATELFKNVRPCSEKEQDLLDIMDLVAINPGEGRSLRFLSDPVKEESYENSHDTAGSAEDREGRGEGTDAANHSQPDGKDQPEKAPLRESGPSLRIASGNST